MGYKELTLQASFIIALQGIAGKGKDGGRFVGPWANEHCIGLTHCWTIALKELVCIIMSGVANYTSVQDLSSPNSLAQIALKLCKLCTCDAPISWVQGLVELFSSLSSWVALCLLKEGLTLTPTALAEPCTTLQLLLERILLHAQRCSAVQSLHELLQVFALEANGTVVLKALLNFYILHFFHPIQEQHSVTICPPPRSLIVVSIFQVMNVPLVQ
mmetsp:Transcript_3702/g.9421  ORF Transcript_3702/g.9421 Transcript_3702/m.9421 type:complete len:215 (+) Transcript_3702:2960-3604(+)